MSNMLDLRIFDCKFDNGYVTKNLPKILKFTKTLNTIYDDFDITKFKTIGEMLRAARQRLEGLTATKVCKYILSDAKHNISYTYLLNVEKNRVQPPSAEILIQLCLMYRLNYFEVLRMARRLDLRIMNVLVNTQYAMEFLTKVFNESANAVEYFRASLGSFNETIEPIMDFDDDDLVANDDVEDDIDNDTIIDSETEIDGDE